MTERPSGTLTFLFTDIEGSTQAWEQDRTAMQDAVARHDRLLRDAIESHGGYVFTTAGDSFAAAFSRAGAAAVAAVDAQRQLAEQAWPEGLQVLVRMGLHTGEADERDGDYFGPAVNLAARVMSRAHGGQIVTSGTTAALLRGEWEVRTLGKHRMKGVSAPVELAQILVDGLKSDFPEIIGSGLAGNLLAAGAVGELVGRSTELAELTASLNDHRLVTLTGVGGVGKTRLALALANAVTEQFDDGCWLVDLAPVVDPDDVPNAVMSALQLRPETGRTMTEVIVDALRDQSLLIVLDNCEHLLTPAALLVRQLTQSAPQVRIAATSREPLAVPGERVFPVPSLDADSDAAELFLSRAEDADPTFHATEADLEVVVQLCRRLDGIPLAIELAAARVRTLGPRGLLARLEDRFRLLRGSQRGVVDRHRTLLAAVEWSYQLLGQDEKDLFSRLSVLPTSFDLEAAEAVCSDGIDDFDVIDLVESLVAKSLLTTFRDEGNPRFRMLETLRQFGESRLDGDTVIEVRDRHLAHYLMVAERARALFEEGPGYEGGDLFDTEWDNIRTAADWAASAPDLTPFDTLLSAVRHYAQFSCRSHDLLNTLTDTASRSDCSVTVLGVAAIANSVAGDLGRAKELAERGLAIDKDDVCLLGAANMANWYAGRVEEGWELAGRWVTRAESAGRPMDRLFAQVARAVLAGTVIAPATAPEFVPEIIDLETSMGSAAAGAIGSWGCARALTGPDDRDRALNLLQRAATLADHPSLRWMRNLTVLSEGIVLLEHNDANAARSIASAIPRFRNQSDWLHLWMAIETAAMQLTRAGRIREAAVIVGYLDQHDRHHALFVNERRELTSRAKNEFPAEHSQGTAMGRDEIIDFALAALDHHDPE